MAALGGLSGVVYSRRDLLLWFWNQEHWLCDLGQACFFCKGRGATTSTWQGWGRVDEKGTCNVRRSLAA